MILFLEDKAVNDTMCPSENSTFYAFKGTRTEIMLAENSGA